MPFIPLQSNESTPRQGFIPIESTRRNGFIPLEDGVGTEEQSFFAPAIETVKDIARVYPVAETAGNLATQMVALPVAGIAGLGAVATKALGWTETEPADVVHNVAGALTYQPQTESGQHLTNTVMLPFEKLQEAGQYAGGKTLDATGSPVAATAVDTAINMAPMALGIKPRPKGLLERASDLAAQKQAEVVPVAEQVHAPAIDPAADIQHVAERPVISEQAMAHEPVAVDPLRSASESPMIDGVASSVMADTHGMPEPYKSTVEPAVVAESDSFRPEALTIPDELPKSGEVLATDSPPLVTSTREGFAPLDAQQDVITHQDYIKAIPEMPVPDSMVSGIVSTESKGFTPIRSVDAGSEVRSPVRTETMPDVTSDVTTKTPVSDGMVTGKVTPETNSFDQATETLASRAEPETLNAWSPGTNFVPLVDDAKMPASTAKTVADLPTPLRRENIIKDFAQGIGTSIYEGRVKGKKLGFFRPRNEEVRIKRANDIEVAAHEVAHLIDSRVPAIANAWRSDTALRNELKSVSYDQKNVQEGFAEGVRLFLTQPEALQSKAPKVHAWLEGFANTHEYGPALRKAQTDMTAWFGQDALNRARSKIGVEKGLFTRKPLADYFDGFWDKFRQSTVDDLHGVYKMERDLTGKLEPNGPYESARLSRASASIADGSLRYGYPVKKPDGSFTFKGKGLEEIMKPVAESMDDALLYFVGRSSRELLAQGREHLFTPSEVDGMLSLRTPEREQAFRDYQAWNKGVLDFAEAQGVINSQARAKWQRTQYLPFHRVGQSDGFKGAKPGDWSCIKALTGGTENIKDVLGNMVQNAAQLIDKAVKNEARVKIADLADKAKGGRFMVKIPAESRPVKIDPASAADAILKAMGINRAEWNARNQPLPKFAQKIVEELKNSPDFLELMVGNQPPAGSNVVAVLRNGKPEWYEVGDPVLYRALSSIDRTNQHWLINWLGLPKRIGQATITMTPDFWAANMARDTIMGSVMTGSGFKPVIDSLRGMRSRIMADPVYKDYIANGGGLSSIYLDETKLRAKMEKFYGRQGIDYRTVLDTPDKLMGFIETLGDAFEMSTRLEEFKKATEAGEHPRHAAYQGREVSTDFAMRGDSQALGMMYDTVMFLKPAVLSWDRLYRGLAHDPNRGAIAIKAGALAMASAGLYLLNREDPRYQDLQDWDRDANWHFFVGDQHFRYPKIWEIGALSSAAERTVERIMDKNPANLAKDFARILGTTFNLNLMPQIVAPLVEQATNKNGFTKAPIETPGMENLQPFMRAKPNTSETLKAAGMATRNLPESLQVNPVRAEALVRGYFNTWAMYGLMLTDQALFRDQLPEKRADELPVVRRFYSQEPAKHTKYEEQFYDLLGESKRLHGTMMYLDKTSHSDIADDIEQRPMTGMDRQMERASRNIQAITKDMNEVRSSNSTPAEKRQRLDALTVEKNALLKEVVIDVKAQVGR